MCECNGYIDEMFKEGVCHSLCISKPVKHMPGFIYDGYSSVLEMEHKFGHAIFRRRGPDIPSSEEVYIVNYFGTGWIAIVGQPRHGWTKKDFVQAFPTPEDAYVAYKLGGYYTEKELA